VETLHAKLVILRNSIAKMMNAPIDASITATFWPAFPPGLAAISRGETTIKIAAAWQAKPTNISQAAAP
jgi:hypothetical protein